MLQIEINDILNGDFLNIAIGLLLLVGLAAFNKFNIITLLFKPRIRWRTLVICFLVGITFIFLEKLFNNNSGIVLFVSITFITIFLIYTIWFPAVYESTLLKVIFRKTNNKIEVSNLKITKARFFLTTQGKFQFYKKFINFAKEGENKYLKPEAFAAIDKLKLFLKSSKQKY